MSTRTSTKLKTPILSSILFFAGIAASVAVLFMFSKFPDQVTFFQVCLVIGLTLFAGVFSIMLTARTVKQTVVYLEKKNEEIRTTTTHTTELENQLSLDPIESLIHQRKDSESIVTEISKQLQAGQAALYVLNDSTLELKCGYALSFSDATRPTFTVGEGLMGRVAKEGATLYIDQLPKGYITIFSGLGSSSPTYLALVPLKVEDEVKGVLEIAVFSPLTQHTLKQLESIGNAWATSGL